MRDDLKGISICGGKFRTKVALSLFEDTNDKKVFISLIFGRNGSGKSTIARAFRKISNPNESDSLQAQLNSFDGNIISLNEEEKKHIFVFDQKFINENIKVEEDGLDTIVMLGNQVDLDERIRDLVHELDEKKDKIGKLSEILEQFSDARNQNSPTYYFNKIKETLKGDSNWAGRDRIIKENSRVNTPVNDNTYLSFINLNPSESRDDLLISFRDKLQSLNERRTGNRLIQQSVPCLTNCFDVNILAELLNEKIEKPVLNERDNLLLDILARRDTSFLNDVRNTFSDPDITNCPFCSRAISKEDKEELIKGIEKILCGLVEEHQKELKRISPNELHIDLNPFAILAEKKDDCERDVINYNRCIKEFNEKIKEKIDNPYEPTNISVIEFEGIRKKLEDDLEELEHERLRYNQKVSDIEELKNELNKINADIAYYDIRDYYESYKRQKEQQEKTINRKNELDVQLKRENTELSRLISQKENCNIAVDEINSSLRYVFFSKDRLQIQFMDGKYRLIVNGARVKPGEISTGETNVIALCYFFSTIGKDKSQEEVLRDNYLIVIDDPITSFDSDNRVGVLSYLRGKLRAFTQGCSCTKFVLMTHDAMACSIISKFLKEIATSYNITHGIKGVFKSWLLCSGLLSEFNLNKNAYTKLFSDTYEYALGSGENTDFPIGNVMRQLVEAFSTFNFRVGIDELVTKERILSLIPDDLREHYKNLVYKIVLDGSSHTEDQIRNNPINVFEPLYSFEDKRRIARELICLLYLLNKHHVVSYLGDYANAVKTREVEQNINIWLDDIRHQ